MGSTLQTPPSLSKAFQASPPPLQESKRPGWSRKEVVLAWYHKGLVPHGHGQPVEVTNGGHQCGSTNGPTSESHQWRSSMGGTSGGLPIGLPVGVTNGGHQWGSPVDVTKGESTNGPTSGGHQWGSTNGPTSGGLHFLAAGMRCWLFAAYRYKGMRKGSVSHLPGYRTTVSSQLPQRCPRPGDRMLPTCALCWWTQEGVARASDQSRYVMPRFRACYCCCLC